MRVADDQFELHVFLEAPPGTFTLQPFDFLNSGVAGAPGKAAKRFRAVKDFVDDFTVVFGGWFFAI